jgi:hypothetical protein
MTEDKEWTTEKAVSTNSLSSNAIPLIPAAGPVSGGAEGGGMEGMMGGMGGMPGMMGGMPGGGRDRDMMGGMEGMMGGMPGSMMGGMMGGMGGMGADAKAKQKMDYLTRTDFMIQMVWKPISEENPPKSLEEIQAALAEASKTANVAPPKEMDFVSKSLEQSKIRSQMYQRIGTAAGAAAAPAGATGEEAAKEQ